MAWIKFEKDLLTDPRVLRMARQLEARWKLYETTGGDEQTFEIGNDEPLPAVTLVCGALVRIWSLADTHLGADDLLPLGIEELDVVVGVPGFCSLLPEDWLLPIDEHTVKLPDFHAHNGTEAKKKAVTQKRVARFRAALHKGNGQALPDQTKTRLDQDLKNKTTSFEPFGSQPAAVEVLPLKGGKTFAVETPFVAELDRAYPAVDVPATLREIRAWLVANPAKQSEGRRGAMRRVNSWCAREQEKHGQHQIQK